jgi:hypothetical protein
MTRDAKSIAWLAGVLEGEGTFGFHGARGNSAGTPKIAVQMTDEDVVARVARMFGRPCNGPYGPYTTQKLAAWQTMVTGSDAVGWMFAVYQFMGERRKKKIEETISKWKTQRVIRPGRTPACHANERYFAKGLCRKCYMRQYHESAGHA